MKKYTMKDLVSYMVRIIFEGLTYEIIKSILITSTMTPPTSAEIPRLSLYETLFRLHIALS